MLNRSGNTTDNLCFRYRFRDVFSRFRCCVYNGTGPLFVHVKHNRKMELQFSATFQKYGNMWFRPVILKQGLKKVALTPGLEKVIWNVFSHIESAISPAHSNVCFGFHAFLLHQYWKRLQTYSHFSWVLLLKMPDGKFLSWLLFNCLSKIS